MTRPKLTSIPAVALATALLLAPPSAAQPSDVPTNVPSAVPAATAAAMPLTTACPSGLQRGTSYWVEDFNRGGVYDPDSGGFYLHGQIDAPGEGSGYGPVGVAVGASGPLVVSFRARTAPVTPAGLNLVLDRQQVAEVPLTTSWQTFRWEISSFLARVPGSLTVALDHSWDIEEGASPSGVDIDDVAVYPCVVPPASGVRGDWGGDGRADLLASQPDGRLYYFAGTGTGIFAAPWQVGFGWAQSTWFGSPGDVTGDRRTDLLATLGGRLFLYPGKGAGALGQSRTIGTGWTDTQIATPGDTGGDGRPDLWAVRSNGTLHLYHFIAGGGLRYDRQIGAGWGGTALVGIGDLTGDDRPDAVAIRPDGCAYTYPGTAASGLGVPTRLFCGFWVMDWVGSPGDLTGDRRGDLLARDRAGTLWLYRGLAGGRLDRAVRVSDGWQSMQHLG